MLRGPVEVLGDSKRTLEKNVTQQKKAMVSEPPKRIQGTRATSQ
jgi:hypothetical protein